MKIGNRQSTQRTVPLGDEAATCGRSDAANTKQSNSGSIVLDVSKWVLRTGMPLLLVLSLAVVLAACSSGGPGSAGTPTRPATQTPWIIYINVTSTPEPPLATPLPTVTVPPAKSTATRTPPKAAPVPTKSPTKPPTPVAVVPSATSAPACPQQVSLLSSDPVRFPDSGTERRTPGPDTFDFKFTPFQPGESDPKMGYEIDMSAKRSGFSNGASLFLSHNWFLANGRHIIFDQRGVQGLASGDNSTVTWNVKVVYAPSGFNDVDHTVRPAGLVDCGASNPPWPINLLWVGS